jgi:hypothetical protein
MGNKKDKHTKEAPVGDEDTKPVEIKAEDKVEETPVERSNLPEEPSLQDTKETPVAPVQPQAETKLRITLCYSEYASRLSGSSALLFAAMRLSHTQKRLTVEEWGNELNIFRTKEV